MRKRINVSLTPECVADLKTLAKERRMSVSALIESLVLNETLVRDGERKIERGVT